MNIVAADIGGTHTRVALVTPDGDIRIRRATPTLSERGAEVAIAQLSELIEDVLGESGTRAVAIGIAVTGPVDHRTGVVDNPYTLKGWGPTDLVTPLSTRFGVPVRIENDANAAALGEHWRGAGRDVERLAVLTIGTGIGLGLLVDGEVQRDAHGRHGEAGHHVLDPHGPPCYCGARGCWEVLAAGPALVRLAQATRLRPSSPAPPAQTPAHIADAVIGAALAGDDAAMQVMREIAGWIGLGLVNTIAFFSPDRIVLGGGLGARCFALIAPTVNTVLERHRAMVPTDIDVVPATAGDDAGVLGAAFGALGLATRDSG